ncbi:MAG: hypothetical protein Q9216_007191 [Gyalolechia sp. 2 TL-2023]
MSKFVLTFIFVLSLINHTFAQSLVQEPASSTLQNLTVDTNIDQLSYAFGASPSSEVSSSKSVCFTNSPGFPKFRPVSRSDCYFLFFYLLTAPSAATPFRWDSDKIPLPARYKYGSCLVSIYAAKDSSKEVFSQLGIARMAALVVQDCVTGPRGFLGGRRPIGNTEGFWVAVGQQ